jgi:RNA polymerase primary sigma factor
MKASVSDTTVATLDSANEPASKPVKPAGKVRGSGRSLAFVNENDPVTAYLNEIKGIKNLTLAQEQDLAKRIQAKDGEALNTLVQANLKFVVAVCRNYQYQGLPMGDLINEGNLGLIRAAQRYDGSLNFKFISYAVWWIRQGILAALAEQSRTLKISAGHAGVMHKVSKANQRLEQKLGRSPNPAELAEAMDKTEFEIMEILQLSAAPMSLNAPVSADEDGSLESLLEDENAPPADANARQHLLKQNLQTVLGTLEGREEMVLRLYYGIGRANALTLEEIAQKLDVTRERVRQIKAKALDRLQHPSRIMRLKSFQD